VIVLIGEEEEDAAISTADGRVVEENRWTSLKA
jgi:hypothetical protein